jgi:hypothetical protein
LSNSGAAISQMPMFTANVVTPLNERGR